MSAPAAGPLPVPSHAFQPFDIDVARVARRLRHITPDDREATIQRLVAQALEEAARSHMATVVGHGMSCDECWWLSKAIAAARAGGWLS